jgi:uncharacterized membrane protein required for colicin V production
MNSLSWLDPVIALILLFAAVRGFATGLIRSVSGLFGIAAGLIAASRYYALAGDHLMLYVQIPQAISDLVCFLLLFSAAFALVMGAGSLLVSLTRFQPLKALDKAGGAVAGFVIGAAFTGVILILLTTFPPGGAFREQVDRSTLAPPLVDATMELYNRTADLLPAYFPDLTFQPEQLPEFSPGTRLQPGRAADSIDFARLDGATCFVCGSPVEFLGYQRNRYSSISPKFICSGCGRTSDGCQTYEGHHLMYEQCPADLGRMGYRFDCGIWSNGDYYRPTGPCPLCGEGT